MSFLPVVHECSRPYPAPGAGRSRLVVVGGGMAAVRLLEELAERLPDGYDVTLVSAEPGLPYNRIQLSNVLARNCEMADIILHPEAWYTTHGIRHLAQSTVIGGSTQGRFVILDSGERIDYDQLVIATGSRPFTPALANSRHPQVKTFRSSDDVQALQQRASCCDHVVVAGAGLLGLEAATGLLGYGCKVSILHNAPFILNRQLDPKAAVLLQQALEDRGLNFVLGCKPEKLLVTDNEFKGVMTSNDQFLPAGMIVFATGVRPNRTLGEAMGLKVNQGILVNGLMQTSAEHVWALGECTEFEGQTFGLVAPLYEQARILAQALVAAQNAEISPALPLPHFSVHPAATTLKVNGVQLYSAGIVDDDEADSLVFEDPASGVYRRLLLKDNCLVGAVLYGDVQHGPDYFKLIQNGACVQDIRQQLLFGGLVEAVQ